MINTNPLKYIITGPPGSGKTSLIQALKKRGEIVFEEIGREIIKEEQAKGGDALPWKNLEAFSKKVLLLRELDHSTHSGKHQFYDRGIPDLAAYFLAKSLPTPPDIHYSALRNRYETLVFGTPLWEDIYHNDAERKESFEEAKALYAALRTVYAKYGYTWVELPKTGIEDRVKFILKALKA